MVLIPGYPWITQEKAALRTHDLAQILGLPGWF